MAQIILDKRRKEVLNQLYFTRRLGWYLAGGTALALQLEHRTSVDFDFYRSREFEPADFLKEFQKRFPKKIEKVISQKNTLIVNILNGEKIRISCFYYKYPLLKSPLKLENVNVASQEDIASMKIIAIYQRGTYRDFVDMYYLLQKFSLQEIFRWALEKYSNFNIYEGLRSLTYYTDAEERRIEDEKRINIFDKSLTWNKVKKYISGVVREYQSEFLRK